MPDALPIATIPTAPASPAPATAMRRTPCVGVCSTTYGDLVCRGCKRFAHEIVGWNGYEEHQRELVWDRLHDLLAQSVRRHLRIVDAEQLRQAATAARLAGAAMLPPEVLAFHLLRVRQDPLAALGVAATSAADENRQALVAAIDREFYTRSRAHYEASFKALT